VRVPGVSLHAGVARLLHRALLDISSCAFCLRVLPLPFLVLLPCVPRSLPAVLLISLCFVVLLFLCLACVVPVTSVVLLLFLCFVLVFLCDSVVAILVV
jgi:hypothetical protein